MVDFYLSWVNYCLHLCSRSATNRCYKVNKTIMLQLQQWHFIWILCFHRFMYPIRVILWMETLAQYRGDIWSQIHLGTRTHIHLVCKWTHHHTAILVSLTKWLSIRIRIERLWVQVPLKLTMHRNMKGFLIYLLTKIFSINSQNSNS